MALKEAIQAHQDGDLEKAKHLYKQAYESGSLKPVLFQNYGAILRQEAKTDSALQIYEKGLAHHPTHIGILINAANLFSEIGRDTSSIELNFRLISLILSGKANDDPKSDKHFIAISEQLLGQLAKVDCFSLGVSLIPYLLSRQKADCRLLLAIRLFYAKYYQFSNIEAVANTLGFFDSLLTSKLAESDKITQLKIRLLLATHAIDESGIDESIAQFSSLEADQQYISSLSKVDFDQFKDIWSAHAWNFSNKLLQQQRFHLGWRLYDYGLITSAPGKQKWQRALKKPYPQSIVPLWNGESLRGKTLFILEEQAIGDVMMFLTLLPSLVKEANRCYLLLNPRLVSIYTRSFSHLIQSQKLVICNASKPHLLPAQTELDFQIPIGSIPQHRFNDIKCFKQSDKVISANPEWTDDFVKKYSALSQSKIRIGLSWRGGGHQKRQAQKSVPLNSFCSFINDLLLTSSIQFVSIQYGDVTADIKQFRDSGIDIIHDTSVDPIKNMDLWLAQVQSCDAVISVANTTIHGAGGLGIPTACLLSNSFDWRWLESVTPLRSYWYPSVCSYRQDADGSWLTAYKEVSNWVASGCTSPITMPYSI